MQYICVMCAWIPVWVRMCGVCYVYMLSVARVSSMCMYVCVQVCTFTCTFLHSE